MSRLLSLYGAKRLATGGVQLSRMTGLKTVLGKLRSVKKIRLGPGFEVGLKKAGLLLLAESQKLVPVWRGPLKASGRTTNIGGKGYSADVVVAYGAGANYAVVVHEDLDKVHGAAFNRRYAGEIRNARTPGQKAYYFKRGENQQAKFLETPARLFRPAMLVLIYKDASR